MAENDGAEQQPRLQLATVVISNAALLITVVGACFAFSGFTYYQELFNNFGLKPFAIELSNVDITAYGAYAVTWTIWSLVKAHWLKFVLTIAAATIIGGVLALCAHRWPWLNRYLNRARPQIEAIGRINSRVLWLMAAFLALGIGFSAGGTAAKQDIAYFNKARQRPLNCYKIKDRTIAGVPLAQDKDTIILVRPSSTIMLPFNEISSCARQRRPPKQQ